MKNNIEKVYGKLPKKKVGLKKHKIDLSLVDDLMQKSDDLSALFGFAEDDNDFLGSAVQRILMIDTELIDNKRLIEEFQEEYFKFLDLANELGVEIPNEIFNGLAISEQLSRLTDDMTFKINSIKNK
jgi:hypothetical protein